jgi:preprotein translocase subunit SecB
MQTSPLQLDDAFIGEITVRPNESATPVGGPNNVVVNTTPSYARHTDNPLKWSVKLLVEFSSVEATSSPYEGHVQCEGYFTVVNQEQPEERQRKLVAVNAPTILYSMARDMVATITGRSRHGKFLLPSVSFIDQLITFPDDPQPEPDGQVIMPAANPANSV